MTAENVEMVDVEVVEKKQVESSSPDVEKKEVEESSPEPEVVEKGDGEAAKDEAPAASTDEQAGEEEVLTFWKEKFTILRLCSMSITTIYQVETTGLSSGGEMK